MRRHTLEERPAPLVGDGRMSEYNRTLRIVIVMVAVMPAMAAGMSHAAQRPRPKPPSHAVVDHAKPYITQELQRNGSSLTRATVKPIIERGITESAATLARNRGKFNPQTGNLQYNGGTLAG